MADDEPYRLDDVMRMLGFRDRDSFRAYRRRMGKLGFPPPMLGMTRPLRWAREPIDDWIKSGGRPAQAAVAKTKSEPAAIDELEAGRARLRARLMQQQGVKGT